MTAEEYIVELLKEKDTEISLYKGQIKDLECSLNDYREGYITIRKFIDEIMKVNFTEDNNIHVSFDSVWSEYDSRRGYMDILMKLLPDRFIDRSEEDSSENN